MLLNKAGEFEQSSAALLLNYFFWKGPLVSEGEAWQSQRKRMLPHFSVKTITHHLPDIAQIVQDSIAEWPAHAPIEMSDAVKQISICVIIERIAGKDWEQPASFRLERFERADVPEHAYLPFGTGVRFCIGRNLAMQEILYAAAYLYKHYNIKIANLYELRLKPDLLRARWTYYGLLRPKNN